MDNALAGAAVAQSDEVALADLPFEFMLNALRLKDGFTLAQFGERTGLAVTAIQRGLEEAERKGLVARDLWHAWPTARGFDFLSDLQAIFLPDGVNVEGCTGVTPCALATKIALAATAAASPAESWVSGLNQQS